MNISITEEQAKLLKVAESSLIPVLLQAGGILPTIYVHTGERVRYFQIQPMSDLDALRELAAETIRQKCDLCLAYVLAYDSSIQVDGITANALIMEAGDREHAIAVEFAVVYDREAGAHAPRKPVATLPSLMNE